MEGGREFQFLEVIGTNVLAKEVVRHLSNLTAKECWESAKREILKFLLKYEACFSIIINMSCCERVEFFSPPLF